jgi:hypothetical protein
MAEAAISPSHRKIRFDDLDRVDKAFSCDGRMISSGDRISISPQEHPGGLFLDGNVHALTVQLVPSRQAPFTGTNWQIRLNDGGTWSLLNQGHEMRRLAGSGTVVSLGSPGLLDRFDTTHWLLYRDLAGFRLRPCMRDSGWLALRNGQAVLAGRDEPVGRSHYWTITAFPKAAPLAEA